MIGLCSGCGKRLPRKASRSHGGFYVPDVAGHLVAMRVCNPCYQLGIDDPDALLQRVEAALAVDLPLYAPAGGCA